jgi:hypothetical protein
MNRGWIVGAALVGALFAGTADAQTAEPDAGAAPAATEAAPPAVKPKPKRAVAKKAKVTKLPSVAVVVVNHRSVGLIELTAALVGGADPVKLAGPLAEGQTIIAHVAHDKACLFNLHGTFADEAETETQSYDLCKNKTIDLVD